MITNKILLPVLCFIFLLAGSTTAQVIKNGYPGKLSYYPGDTADIFICAVNDTAHVKLYLLDATNKRTDSVTSDLFVQKPGNSDPWLNGFGYTRAVRYIIPDIKSGLYSFENKVFFIIKSRGRKTVTVVFPTNTFAAYDTCGGKSLYTGKNLRNGDKANTVSFLRPKSPGIIRWLNQMQGGILSWLISQPDIDYKFISDTDMDDYRQISDSKLLMVIGHSEYWTRKARRNFDRFVDQGGNAAVLSGNTMCWQARYSNDLNQVICFRDVRFEQVPDSLKTSYWTDPVLHYPVTGSIGVDWLHGAMGAETPHGWNGYKITAPNSPFLYGTGLKAGDTLMCNSSEYDGAPLAGFDSRRFPVPDTARLGFTQVELIGFDYGKKPGSYNDTAWGTFIVFQKTPQSGIVVNTAFNEFTYKGEPFTAFRENPHPTGFGGRDSLVMKKICRNMVDLLLKGQTVFSSPHPAALTTALPSHILHAFNRKFPRVKYDDWIREKDNITFAFALQQKRYYVSFSQDGRWVSTQREMEPRRLPQNVLADISKGFPNGTVLTAYKISKPKNQPQYQFTIAQNSANLIVNYSATGTTVTRCEEGDDSDDL